MNIERLTQQEILAIHSMQLAWFGGSAGLADEASLDSILSPASSFGSGDGGVTALFAKLAAEYAILIAENRPFRDGNKRTALIVAFTFLGRNGFSVAVSPEEAYAVFVDLASGMPSREQFRKWLQPKIFLLPR